MKELTLKSAKDISEVSSKFKGTKIKDISFTGKYIYVLLIEGQHHPHAATSLTSIYKFDKNLLTFKAIDLAVFNVVAIQFNDYGDGYAVYANNDIKLYKSDEALQIILRKGSEHVIKGISFNTDNFYLLLNKKHGLTRVGEVHRYNAHVPTDREDIEVTNFRFQSISFERYGNGFTLTENGDIRYYKNNRFEKVIANISALYESVFTKNLPDKQFAITHTPHMIYLVNDSGLYKIQRDKILPTLELIKEFQPSTEIRQANAISCIRNKIYVVNSLDINKVRIYREGEGFSSKRFIRNLQEKPSEQSPLLYSMLMQYALYNRHLNGLFDYLPFNYQKEKIKIFSLPYRFLYNYQNSVEEYLTIFDSYVKKAKKAVSISTLWINTSGGGKQEENLKKTFKDLMAEADKNKKVIVVKLVYSEGQSAEEVAKYLTKDGALNPYFHLYVYQVRNYLSYLHMDGIPGLSKIPKGTPEHIHSKILAVDDDYLITGGINFIDEGYSSTQNPIHDLSVVIELTNVAYLGHEHVHKLICRLDNKTTVFNQVQKANALEIAHIIAQPYDEPRYSFINPYLTSTTDFILGVGKISGSTLRSKDWATTLTNDTYSAGAKGILIMLRSAKKSICIVQQAILLNTDIRITISQIFGEDRQVFANKVCKAIGQALFREVEVKIVLSGYKDGAGDYDCLINDIREIIQEIGKEIQLQIDKEKESQGTEKKLAKSCDTYLSFLEIRMSGQKFGKNPKIGKTKQHAKMIMVDDETIYVGSENIYYNDHAEFGVIIYSKEFAKKFISEYWLPTWNRAHFGINKSKEIKTDEQYFIVSRDNFFALELDMESAKKTVIVRNDPIFNNKYQIWTAKNVNVSDNKSICSFVNTNEKVTTPLALAMKGKKEVVADTPLVEKIPQAYQQWEIRKNDKYPGFFTIRNHNSNDNNQFLSALITDENIDASTSAWSIVPKDLLK